MRSTRQVLIVIGLVFVGLSLFGLLTRGGGNSATPTSAPVAAARPTAVPAVALATPTSRPPALTIAPTPRPTLTPVPSPGDQFVAAARKQFGPRLRDAKIDEFGFAAIDYDLGDTWDESSAVRTVAADFQRLAPMAFAGDVDTFRLRAYADFNDVRGNSSTLPALGLTISHETAASLNWQNIQGKNLHLILIGSHDGIYVHSALRKAWDSYQGR